MLMKRARGLVELSRREFCGLVGIAAAAGVTLVGCGSSDPGAVDAAVAPDAPAAGGCATGGIDVGLPTVFLVGKPVYFSAQRMFVVRDSGGLYALTARCTHQGVTIAVSGTRFACPAHGATFDFTGGVLGGPTSTPLVHYAMCTLPNGHVGVTIGTTVPKTTRLMV